MKKIYNMKQFKRVLALLLVVSMVFTPNVFGMDTVSAKTVESTTESEDAAVQNDNDTALEEGKESGVINEDSEPISENEGGEAPEGVNEESGSLPDNEDGKAPEGENEESGSLPDNEDGEAPEGENEESGSLPDNEDESSPVEDEEPLQNVDNGEELPAEVSGNGERLENPTYLVLKLDNANAFEAVLEIKDQGELWKDPYVSLWKETDSLNTYLTGIDKEYVVIQQVNSSIKSEDKILELPANIKGARLVYEWDKDANDGKGATVNWQLNELSIKGAATSVYLTDLVIDSDENKLTIDFSAAGENNSKVVLNHNVVNAQICCASTAGTIGFIEDNILVGYSVKCKTEFSKTDSCAYVDLLINGEAGLSFEEITGDMDVAFVFNGYPKNTESLPRFNKKIDLGVGIDKEGEEGEEGKEYNRGIGLNFWEQNEAPFWLDESQGEDYDWWKAGEASALKFTAGTQVAYFAGRNLIGENVHCNAKNAENEEQELYLNSATGKLEIVEGIEENAAYCVLKLDDEASFNAVKADKELLWEREWDATDYLDEYLARDGMEYVVIQATPRSYNSESKKLEIPENIKGALLIYGWDGTANDGDGESVEWQLNELSIAGAETSVYLFELGIDTVGNEKFTIGFSEAENNSSKVVFEGNNVVNAQIYCESTAGTIRFIEQNILGGYSVKCKTEFSTEEFSETTQEEDKFANLLINGDAGLSFEEITGDMAATIVFNGYPDKPEKSLPHFNKEINLGQVEGTKLDDEGNAVIDDEGNAVKVKYNRSIDICFWQYKESPFWLDGTEDWWEAVPAVTLEKGKQVAYFAGRKLIGENVHYYSHYTEKDENGNEINKNDGLHLNSATGKLEKDGEDDERLAYGVLKLENKDAFEGLMEDDSPLWDEESEEYYGDLWDETDYLDQYLARDGMEYVVIQATKTSHNSENKSLVLPANIKGVMLVNDWDNTANEGNGAAVEWQLNELNITGAETCVFLSGNIIETDENEKFTINFSAEGTNNKSEVICRGIVVNAQINCESTAGTIDFINNNILKGYSVKCKTEFHEYGNLLINGEAGNSFEEITGDTDACIIFNGYPKNPENLPHFNKEINLGEGINEEGSYTRVISIGFWKHQDAPFGLDGTDDWWEAVPAVTLEAGTQVAYFAGDTLGEKEQIGNKVNYYSHNEENNLCINHYTGKLELESASYRVLKLDNRVDFDNIIKNYAIPWDDERWEAIDSLDEYLKTDGMGYVIIQATNISHESENKSLELPATIKGVLLLSEHYEEDQEDHVAAWQLNTINAKGSTEIHIYDAGIDPMNHESEDSEENQGFKIETMAADVKVVIAHSEIMGDLSVSGIANIKFIDSKVFGATDLGSGNTTKVTLESLFVADNLSGYSALEINGDTTFIVRYHGEVVIENCTLNKTNDEDQRFTLVYNGYPQEASLLPVFGDSIADNCGITLRFVKQSDEYFWEEDWWDKTPDENLLIGSQIATVNIDGDKYNSFIDKFCYWCSDEEKTKDIEFDRDETGALFIQKRSASGNQIVDFALSVDSEKEYDGRKFEVNKDSVFNSCGYTGDVELSWESKDGKPLTEAPKDAGEYRLKASVPEGTEGYEGSNKIPVVITPKTVTVRVSPHMTETKTPPVTYDIIWTGFVNGDTYVKQAEVEQGAETTDETGTYYMLSIKGGEVSSNYIIVYGDPVKVTIITEDTKPCINNVLFPKKKPDYSAVYTGEQIRPVMVVAYDYKDDKGRAKTQKLKLNVDYTVTYDENVDVGTAKVTVTGIGEYTGVITKEFSITPKSIKKVTLSPVGDIIYGDEPTVTVMDGNHELVEGEDYEIVLSSEGSATADTQSELKVKGIGNYNEESKKKVKFNILKTSTEIKSIASDGVTVEFKKPDKVYTYNGKAQKPAVVVKDGGVKVPASQYKVIYTNNVKAGTQTAIVKVVGVSKKGKGYYGIASTELKFDIKQKDLSKIKASIKGTIPKAGTIEDIKKAIDEALTVTDGKHVLSEDEYTVDYGSITKTDDIVIGTKYPITVTATADGNYVKDTKKVVNIKFGQLNLASKTAAVSVKIKDAANNKVEVKYNGTLLTEGTDYTAQVKQDKNKSTYTVTIKAVKKAAYKGKKVVKNLTVESEE